MASRKEARDTAREAAQTTQQAQQTKEYLLFRKEEQLLDTNSKLCRQISYSLNFRKRTFKTKKILHKVTVEQVRLKLEEECQECKGQLLASQLRKAIQRAISEVNQKTKVLCTFCGNQIDQPRLKVTIGKKVK